MPDPYWTSDCGTVTLYCGDCRDVLPTLADSSIDLIATDPPYNRVKGEEWDRQWKTDTDYLDWLGNVADEWQRVLKPNGSLYCFASTRMAAQVEMLIGKRFNVLNAIRWDKEAGWAKRQCKEEQRAFFPSSETIVFAEHYGADNIAKGEVGYAAKCDELRGFVFEPLRAYLDSERKRAGITVRQVAEAFQQKTGSRTVTGMAGHWFTSVQWVLPTEANYNWLRELFAGDYLRREYEDLRREYEDLRREYEDLRRPFNVSADVPYTDVWTFTPVNGYAGKHPCEKPIKMMDHIISASSRPRAVVLDCFSGSGATLESALSLGREAIGIEISPDYCAIAKRRIEAALGKGTLFDPAVMRQRELLEA